MSLKEKSKSKYPNLNLYFNSKPITNIQKAYRLHFNYSLVL